MRAAGRLFLAVIPAVRPVHDLERPRLDERRIIRVDDAALHSDAIGSGTRDLTVPFDDEYPVRI